VTTDCGGTYAKGAGRGSVRLHLLIRFLLVALLAAAVGTETYYIAVLRDTIDRQTEELRSLSMQLQSSKNESTDLREELSLLKKLAGEKKDGNTTDRQH
jgi:hypothetical protein